MVLFPVSPAFAVTFVKSQSSGSDKVRVSRFNSLPHPAQVGVVHYVVQNYEIQGNALTPVHIFAITDDKADFCLFDEILYPLLAQAQN